MLSQSSSIQPSQIVSDKHKHLRLFSKCVCGATLLLIFIGAMVTSTDSGLAVPDWPLSYGSLFPPMVGGVFYEHGHRMAAALVGFLMLCLTIWVAFVEQRKWVRNLTFIALGAVIIQGLLGGLTVLLFLPPPISVCHGVLAQTFFIMTIVIAYSQSNERHTREVTKEQTPYYRDFLKLILYMTGLIFVQLIVGAVMRHTGSGLAIYDFPTMAGYWIPPFNDQMLARINDWRFEYNYDYVSLLQVVFHFSHRVMAMIIIIFAVPLTKKGLHYYAADTKVFQTLMAFNLLLAIQVIFGITTVLTQKVPIITTTHVFIGAATLGLSVLLLLRAAPLTFQNLTQILMKEKA